MVCGGGDSVGSDSGGDIVCGDGGGDSVGGGGRMNIFLFPTSGLSAF